MRGNNYLRSELHVKSGFEQVRFFRWAVCLNLDETPFFKSTDSFCDG